MAFHSDLQIKKLVQQLNERTETLSKVMQGTPISANDIHERNLPETQINVDADAVCIAITDCVGFLGNVKKILGK
ncbi:MAG: hypothetical protein K2P84_02745 [Undibacterium sp.]|nr:hypothetical protein [Undibacterium sp.]